MVTTYALLAVFAAGTPHADVQIVRAGLTRQECAVLAAVFRYQAITAAYECRPD